MKHDGKTQPVRRVLLEACGQELNSGVRIGSACGNPLCVHPYHTLVKSVFSMAMLLAGIEQSFDHGVLPANVDIPADDDINEVIDAVYSHDQPWDAAELAAYFDYPQPLVEEAIRRIHDEGL